MDLISNINFSDWRLWSSIAVLLTSAVGYWYYSFVHVPHTYGPLSKIPSEGWPLWGRIKLNYHTVMGSRPLYILNLHKKYGNTVLVGAHMVSCTDKKAVDKIYSTYQFPKADEYKTYNVYGGENMFSTRRRNFHALRRRIITPIVANNNLDAMESVVYTTGTVALVDHIDRKLKKGSTVDLFDAFHRSTVDVIFELFFGSGFNFLTNTYIPLVLLLKIVFVFLAARPVLPFIGFGADIVVNVVVALIYALWTIRPPAEDEKGVLSQFLAAKDPETGKKLTWTEVIREVLIILVGGMDTTAITISWTFWLMLKYPEVYKEVQQEIDRVFPNKNVAPCADTCKSSLPIFEAVSLESMRMYPVSGEYLPRTAPIGGTTLSGYAIPENTIVFCSPLAYHRNPELWDKPDEFNYKRWLVEDNTALKAQLMVFSQGPRGCPGRALAWTEMFFMTVALLQRYDMTLTPGQDNIGDKPLTYFLMKPANYKMKAELTKRAEQASEAVN